MWEESRNAEEPGIIDKSTIEKNIVPVKYDCTRLADHIHSKCFPKI